MAFLMPAFLAGLVAAALPVLLHLLKRDAATRRNFSAVFLIKRTPVEQTGQRRLRELNLLALRVTALALLALAFARPYLTGVVAGTGGGLTVVAIDRSFSMSGPGQFDRARELASDAVRAVRLGERVAVVVFD
ncbi:MAG: BatA domain-containing protein, partial [Acidobacteriota bacterium]|nr:BatA domain-containing protein [Acidobacteriota bacterium]